MSRADIDYKDKGFVTSDLFIQLALFYINEELKNDKYTFSEKNSLLKYNEEVINGVYAGWFAFFWDSYLLNLRDEQTMIQILENVKSAIRIKGDFISVEELQSIPTKDGDFKLLYRRPFPITELIRIFNALSELLKGNWQYENYEIEIEY